MRRLVVTLVCAVAVGLAAGVGPAGSARAQTGGACVGVGTYGQRRNLSCEYAALTLGTGAFGTWISGGEFDGAGGWGGYPH